MNSSGQHPTPEAILERYATAVERFLALRGRRQREKAPDLDHYVEAEVRIGQLLYILSRFRAIEQDGFRVRFSDAHPCSRMMAADLGAPELEFYAEAFYYIAVRLQDVLQRTAAFRGLDVPTVRRVRDHLIEHADRPRGVMNRNYQYDCPQGFVLKEFGGDDTRMTFDIG